MTGAARGRRGDGGHGEVAGSFYPPSHSTPRWPHFCACEPRLSLQPTRPLLHVHRPPLPPTPHVLPSPPLPEELRTKRPVARNGLGKVEDHCMHDTGIEHLCPVRLSPTCLRLFPAFLGGERKGAEHRAFPFSPPSPPCPTWNINVRERGLSPHAPCPVTPCGPGGRWPRRLSSETQVTPGGSMGKSEE